MSKIFKDKITAILNSNTLDFSGFTSAVHGATKRYIVANTHNKPSNIDEELIEKLTNQADLLFLAYDNVNIGGWLDTEKNELYIDVSTSFDDLSQAISFGKETSQIAIWDNLEHKEIKIKY